MSTQWRSKYAVLRDLSEVTHGQVPGDIAASISKAKERPVFQFNEDDIDDEYLLRLGAGDAGLNEAPPDLTSLKDLLKMIKDGDEDNEDTDVQPGALEITKLNMDAKPFVPTNKNKEVKANQIYQKQTNTEEKEKIIRKRSRFNVAITSILQAKEQAQMKLMKPEDFIPNSIEKSKNKEETNNKDPDAKHVYYDPLPESTSPSTEKKAEKKYLMLTSSVSMFKKKTPANKVEVETVIKSPPKPCIKSYVPSARVDEIYQSFNKDIEKKVVNDIWTKAELEMKRREEVQQFENTTKIEFLYALNLKAFENGIDKNRLLSIVLPRHRHEIQDDCPVCRALCRPNPGHPSSGSLPSGSLSGSPPSDSPSPGLPQLLPSEPKSASDLDSEQEPTKSVSEADSNFSN